MPRIQGLSETGILTGEQQIKAQEGYIFSLTIAWYGCTVGDLCFLRDSASGAGSGHDEVPIALATANGTLHMEWAQGKHFANGIFMNYHSISGNMRYALTYK